MKSLGMMLATRIAVMLLGRIVAEVSMKILRMWSAYDDEEDLLAGGQNVGCSTSVGERKTDSSKIIIKSLRPTFTHNFQIII